MRFRLLVLIGVAACGSGASDFVEELTPAMQSTLDRHGDRLGPSMHLVPRTITDPLCASEMPAISPDFPLVPRELAESIIAKNVKVLSVKTLPFFTEDPYSALIKADHQFESRDSFQRAMTMLDAAKVVGVLVTTAYTPAKVSGRDILELGHFEGWLAVLDLRSPRVLALVPVSADSETMLSVPRGGPVDELIRIGHEGRIIDAAAAALAGSCPAIKLRSAKSS